ncbi:MAG: response regulator transcription factor [Anaerolineales bacterium]|nr:response regulator transcription factor [Anaerolineales bacterium]
MNPIRILVVDDHALFRQGLVGLLEDMPDFSVVGQADSGIGAIKLVHELSPDLVLMDVNMPEMDGVNAVIALRARGYQGHILMLTISQNEQDLLGALNAGADGYVLKNLEPEDLERAIVQVREGMGVLSPEVTKTVLDALQQPKRAVGSAGLSPRELEVIKLVAEGATTGQVAARLYISESTVKTHIKNILKKLDAANRVEAIHKAHQLGLV